MLFSEMSLTEDFVQGKMHDKDAHCTSQTVHRYFVKLLKYQVVSNFKRNLIGKKEEMCKAQYGCFVYEVSV